MIAKRYVWLHFLAVAVSLSTLLTVPCHGEDKDTRILAERLFRGVESRFRDIKSLRYTVERTLRLRKLQQNEMWIFMFRQPEDLSIEYTAPHNRRIVLNGMTLWEYIPETGKAMRTDLAALDDKRKRQVVSSVLSRVTVEGLRLGDYSAMLDRVVSVREEDRRGPVYVVEGAGPKYVVCIDASRNVLVETELYDESGRLKLRTEASGFVEVAPSFWFPREIESSYRTEQGVTQDIIRLSGVSVNEDLSEWFKFAPPPEVEVINN